MRRGIGSSQKGGAHERAINRKLSLWLSHGERDDLLTRNVLSGGAHTRGLAKGKARFSPGDALAAHPRGWEFLELFHVEYKHWRQLRLDAFMWNERGELYHVLDKLQRQCRDSGHHFFLVARQNHKPDLVFLPAQIGLNCCDVAGNYHLLFSGSVYATRLDHLLDCSSDTFIEVSKVQQIPKRWRKR